MPVEEEGAPENTSVDLDIFTKTTNSSTDPATGDIVQVSYPSLKILCVGRCIGLDSTQFNWSVHSHHKYN